jgi:hypothetical protein
MVLVSTGVVDLGTSAPTPSTIFESAGMGGMPLLKRRVVLAIILLSSMFPLMVA